MHQARLHLQLLLPHGMSKYKSQKMKTCRAPSSSEGLEVDQAHLLRLTTCLQAGLPRPAQFGGQAAGTPMPECPAQAVAVPMARLPATGDLGQPAGALSSAPAERKPSPGPALHMRPALLPGGSNVVSRPSAPPTPAGGGAPASASTSRPGSGAPGASRPELRFAASR